MRYRPSEKALFIWRKILEFRAAHSMLPGPNGVFLLLHQVTDNEDVQETEVLMEVWNRFESFPPDHIMPEELAGLETRGLITTDPKR